MSGTVHSFPNCMILCMKSAGRVRKHNSRIRRRRLGRVWSRNRGPRSRSLRWVGQCRSRLGLCLAQVLFHCIFIAGHVDNQVWGLCHSPTY